MSDKKIRVGVLGGYRGGTMIQYCKVAENAEVVAICDKAADVLEAQKERANGYNITFYDNFDEFIKHDMDAVVLANYAHQHAPFAIKAMKAGKHVFSEVLPMQTMKEAVELVETVEETGKIYAYGENFCYMPAPYEMRKLYKEGKIGELEYAECEYLHNCEPIWPSLTYGEKDHWRNTMYATFYCTHSFGPIIHSTGLRPVCVAGFESLMNHRNLRTGSKSGQFGIEMVTLENGAIVKSIHGGLYKNSIWYSMYGSKGRMESAREDAEVGDVYKLYINADEFDGAYETEKVESYRPDLGMDDKARDFAHAGADFYSMYNFIEKIKGTPAADIIDVYEALDMGLAGLFAYRSVLDGGAKKEIPNLRLKEERDKWREDTSCTSPETAGDMLLPTCSTGTPDIDDGVYDHMKELWDIECSKEEGTYRAMSFAGVANNDGVSGK